MTFVPGLELSRRLYDDAVRPILEEHLPDLRYAAGLVGSGSEVLGFDTERSTDHDWGPRLLIMLDDAEPDSTGERLTALLDDRLPGTIAGYPTRFGDSPLEPGTPVFGDGSSASGPHGVTVGALTVFLRAELGIDSTAELDAATWLTMSEQHLLEVTAGAVWRDDHGTLTGARCDLTWYPDDVWRYRLAAGWKRIAQHEAFIGRSGEAGDDRGSQLVAVAIVRDVMQLAFCIQRRYAPYEKWFGTAFAQLALAKVLADPLDRARYATDWRTREAAVVEAVVVLADAQNGLGLCPAIEPTPRAYFNRPFTVVETERFADALSEAITDPVVRALARHLGGIDQYLETTEARERIDLHQAIRGWLRSSGPAETQMPDEPPRP